jgi:hypothetical protein
MKNKLTTPQEFAEKEAKKIIWLKKWLQNNPKSEYLPRTHLGRVALEFLRLTSSPEYTRSVMG